MPAQREEPIHAELDKDDSVLVSWHHATLSRQCREQLNGHRSFLIWFTGLSGAGKSTLAHATEERLYQMGCRTIVLDGDDVRHGLCADLGFSEVDRRENLRRICEVSKLFLEAGVITLAAFISPLRADRQWLRSQFRPEDFFEVFVDCPLEVCEARDVKGLYQQARSGKVANFTGISAPYEPPEKPDLVLRTDRLGLEECVVQVLELARRAMSLPR